MARSMEENFLKMLFFQAWAQEQIRWAYKRGPECLFGHVTGDKHLLWSSFFFFFIIITFFAESAEYHRTQRKEKEKLTRAYKCCSGSDMHISAGFLRSRGFPKFWGRWTEYWSGGREREKKNRVKERERGRVNTWDLLTSQWQKSN